MRVLFNSTVTGAPCDFLWQDGIIHTGDFETPYDWIFSFPGKRSKCIRSASEAAGCDLVVTPCTPQAKFWKKHTQHPAWCRILPKNDFRMHIEKQVKSVIEFLENDLNKYYLDQFQTQQRLIDFLQPSKVVNSSLSEHGFVPDCEGFVQVPSYDNAHSSTGRMTVRSGPRILTLPKDQRGCIVSRWSDGILVEVDFNALDARVLSWITGHDSVPGDMYEWIGKSSGIDAPRSIIKEATLSAMYGMSKRNFALRYQDMPDAVDLYEKVRSFMQVKELEERLSRQDPLRNAFGRHLSSTNARISHHVQSSAVDVACSGFEWLVNQTDSDFCLPIFLIHDAIVLDIKKDYLGKIEEICKFGLLVPIIDQYFPVRIRRF